LLSHPVDKIGTIHTAQIHDLVSFDLGHSFGQDKPQVDKVRVSAESGVVGLRRCVKGRAKCDSGLLLSQRSVQ
jgi:hypothetical protein